MKNGFKKEFFFHSSLPFLFGILCVFFFSFSSPTHASTVTWTGTTSTAWNIATNWSGGTGVPTSTDDVVINYTGTNQPTLSVQSGSVTINSLTLGG